MIRLYAQSIVLQREIAEARWTLEELRHTAYLQEGEVDSETRQLAATQQETCFFEHEAQRCEAEAREEESEGRAVRDDLSPWWQTTCGSSRR